MRSISTASLVLALTVVPGVLPQGRYSGDAPRKPKPAFAGQTDAPKPSKPSAAPKIESITNRLNGPWSEALLPNGNFLVTESTGLMRIVRPDGVVSQPLAGVPDVKVVAAQGLHDIVLDPDFARPVIDSTLPLPGETADLRCRD